MSDRSFFRLLAAAVTCAFLAAQGCGPRAPDRPEDQAEAVVEEVLDAWSRGESPDRAVARGRPLLVTDPDWRAGYRLLSFLSVGSKPSQEQPGRVRCRVALSLQDRQGRKVDKEVVYEVEVGEKVVIARAPH